MTGYGRGQHLTAEGSWLVEMRCVNSRFLDPHLRLPPGLNCLEERIKKLLAQRLSRGRVALTISAKGGVEPPPSLELNRPLVKEFLRVLDELGQELGAPVEPNPALFLANRDLVRVSDPEPDQEKIWAEIEPALQEALDGVEVMRRVEGEALAEDFRQRLERLDVLFQQAESRTPDIVEAYRKRLTERIAQLLEESEPDPQRLALEVAIIADKCDVTEEAVRAQSHLAQFRSFLNEAQPVGRKLDFLLQELNREANTIGSKSPDAEASQSVVEIKTELERLREQVQNIE